jgi:hypothetical protein
VLVVRRLAVAGISVLAALSLLPSPAHAVDFIGTLGGQGSMSYDSVCTSDSSGEPEATKPIPAGAKKTTLAHTFRDHVSDTSSGGNPKDTATFKGSIVSSAVLTTKHGNPSIATLTGHEADHLSGPLGSESACAPYASVSSAVYLDVTLTKPMRLDLAATMLGNDHGGATINILKTGTSDLEGSYGSIVASDVIHTTVALSKGSYTLEVSQGLGTNTAASYAASISAVFSFQAVKK